MSFRTRRDMHTFSAVVLPLLHVFAATYADGFLSLDINGQYFTLVSSFFLKKRLLFYCYL